MSPFYKNSITERELVKRCLNREQEAQRLLFDTFSGRLMTVCRRYGRTVPEAEDMLQESFINIFLSLNSFKSTGSLFAWLKAITVNTSIKVLRKKYNKIICDEVIDDVLMFEAQNIHFDLNAEDLIAVINKLPLGYRSVFNLYELEGYSHKEVAQLLDISENTSRSQLAKAKRVLKSLIPDYQRFAV